MKQFIIDSSERRRLIIVSLAVFLIITAVAGVYAAMTKEEKEEREQLLMAQCWRNINQISQGMEKYLADHDGTLPDSKNWQKELEPYVKNKSVFNCMKETFNSSLAMNDVYSTVNIKDIESPGAKVLFFEAPLGKTHGTLKDINKKRPYVLLMYCDFNIDITSYSKEVLQEKNMKAKCLTNLRQIGTAMWMYSSDWDGFLPDSRDWQNSLRPYVKNDNIFVCPEKDHQSSYVMNDVYSEANINKIDRPAEEIIFFEAPLGTTYGTLGDMDTGKPQVGAVYADGHARHINSHESPAALKTKCLSNLKQLGTAMLMYSGDYDGFLPDANNWQNSLRPYVKNDNIFICPEKDHLSSYAMNDAYSGADINKIDRYAEEILLFEAPFGLSHGITEDMDRSKYEIGVVYADGHASYVKNEKGIENTLKAQCISNVKQILLAMHMYAADHGGILPDFNNWQEELKPYVKTYNVFHCPEKRGKAAYIMQKEYSGANVHEIGNSAEEILIYEDPEGYPHRFNQNYLEITLGYVDGHVSSMAVPDDIAGQAKEKDQHTKCLSNIRQLSTAMMLYLADHDNIFPDSKNWQKALDFYIKDKSILTCPEEKYPSSYAMNDALSGVNSDTIENPAEEIVFFEAPLGTTHGTLKDVNKEKIFIMFGYYDGHSRAIKPENLNF